MNPSESHDIVAPAAILVRMSAIGDTLISTRTQATLRERGYAPFLISHLNNSSLLPCMPSLRGACLFADDGTASFWIAGKSPHGCAQVDKDTFLAVLKEHCGGSTNNVPVLDLQNTRRSARAIRTFEHLFGQDVLRFQRYKVAKLTFWRLALIVWAYLSLRQWNRRRTPQWLKKQLKPVHELQKELAARLPQMTITGGQPLPWQSEPLALPPEALTSVPKGDCIVFLVGASFRLKSWPREHFRTLLNFILTRTAAQVVLCGGREDVAVGEYLEFPKSDRVINKIGKSSLAETLSLIASARYVVTGDSFAGHAADLLRTPASVIFGATHPLLGFAPVGQHVTVHHTELSCSPCSRHGQGQCRFKNMRCLTEVTPEEVFAKIEFNLRNRSQSLDTARHLADS
ncbi:MAG: hypothetical protein RIR26_132 [Pseudomonadota bacterium]|jgi:hypothetical protein